jgi:hypothetical protein
MKRWVLFNILDSFHLIVRHCFIFLPLGKTTTTKKQEARDAYYNKNYPDWFASVGKVMIKKADGSYMVVTDGEAAALQKAGRLTFQSATTKGGGIDYTQKPILTLKE